MNRFFSVIVASLALSATSAFASVGGPFDDGFNSNQLNSNSLMQATLSFANGSGFCYFSPVALLDSSDITVPATDARGTLRNRMVIYYKGVTYIGSALGSGDQETRSVQCSLNGASEASETSITSQASSNAFSSAFNNLGSSTALTSTILASSRSFTVNGNFTAHIYQVAPTLRFRGKGQLAFLSPSSAGSVAGLAFTGFSGLINAIVTAVGNANVGQNFDPNVFTDAQQAIQNALTVLPPLLTGASIDATFNGADLAPMTVEGTRRYL